MSVNKALRLLKEAEEDLRIGCYDKAVSSAYFSVRMMAELYLKDTKTRKDDKLANALGRKLGDEVRKEFLFLFEMRKEADHRDKIFSQSEADKILRRAKRIFNVLLDLLQE
ncbi:MAG: HEPN domain-containing protein [Candidatus Korarchaeota archaeon]|nr:HEPN domain-containing protein [Candidatus Korarchaeota archaeon]